MKILGKETLREKLLMEKVKELEEIIESKEKKEQETRRKEALIYLKGVCDEYKRNNRQKEVVDYDVRIRM
jgi:predicted RNase H-like nuclease (RuvC/YqgF family)